MSVDELIKAANQLNESDLNRFLQQVVTLRTQRKASVLSVEEAQLLAKINQAIPATLQEQYQRLRTKREEESLTSQEHSQLIELSKQIEQLSAERLEALATLAQLRQVSLSELMSQLGLAPASYV
ncbi:STAS/SEC14 domain-containing protein [cf. Phormidesmis sp. LEGE 11477]|uniref:STAS/SEC14 domain-containing protein n=1 Tax=cf. Phormidesmis sp. LEGE 11477 TaxID=1828680 RepID=UPI001881A9EC|nr:STAS/SEC14 domain-containing protein [cf. Phormidesmis sp. LEGE 11477]MBE9060332.1 STAS/SEC14 domain-containing protein [cf. Phormidesmis sp. LEGE 11477]